MDANEIARIKNNILATSSTLANFDRNLKIFQSAEYNQLNSHFTSIESPLNTSIPGWTSGVTLNEFVWAITRHNDNSKAISELLKIPLKDLENGT